MSVILAVLLTAAGNLPSPPPPPPATQTCPDGSLILATDYCPAEGEAAPASDPGRTELACNVYLSPAMTMPGGYPRQWLVHGNGSEWSVTVSGGQADYRATQTGQRSLALDQVTFRDANGYTLAYRFIGLVDNDTSRRVLVEIGQGQRPPLSYLCDILS